MNRKNKAWLGLRIYLDTVMSENRNEEETRVLRISDFVDEQLEICRARSKKRWFAAAVMAIKMIEGRITVVQDKPLILCADSEEEAIGICLLGAKKEYFPEKDGWEDHKVSVIEFPEND